MDEQTTGVQRGADDPRQVNEDEQQLEPEQRHDDENPRGHGDTNPTFEDRHPFVRRAERHHAAENRADPSEQVRHAGDVGDDVVAVEPDDRQQLVDDLEVLHERDEQQRFEAGYAVGDDRPDDDDH